MAMKYATMSSRKCQQTKKGGQSKTKEKNNEFYFIALISQNIAVFLASELRSSSYQQLNIVMMS